MCGIVGAIAERNVAQILLEGLKRLEYRGYDSAGLAIINPNSHAIECLRAAGKISHLQKELKTTPLRGANGIAHTRWATHGKPSPENAHPHTSGDNDIAIVHNGIIENHELLRKQLQSKGYHFTSDTDTEVIVHLLHFYNEQEQDFIKAIQHTTKDLVGAYALGVISTATPNTLFAIRKGSPLVIGVGIEEHFIASDPLALLPVTQQFIYLEDGDVAELTTENLTIFNEDHKPVTRPTYTSEVDFDTTSKGHYRHYMQKEIFEQQQALLDTINGHIYNNEIHTDGFGHDAGKIFPKIENIHICACGTSYHAGMVASYWLESIAKIPTQVEIASEFRYRQPVVQPNTLFVALSQSGETADTLSALRTAKERGYAATLSICNVPESSLARETDLLFLTRAGTEVGVAATKTFTAQLVALLLLTICFKQIRAPHEVSSLVETLNLLPKLSQETLELDKAIKKISQYFAHKENALFLGRGALYPIALEGALKLKEISYVHAEAYPAGELKHGPLALIDKDMPTIVIAPNDALIEKLESNVQEVQARQGEIFLFIDETVDWRPEEGTHVIQVPATPNLIAPIVYTIPLQLLAYHVAVLKGTDVDQPRNLAKSVTVE